MPQGDVGLIVTTFLVWSGLWAWLLLRRSARATMRHLFMIVTGFAVLAALIAPGGQEFLSAHVTLMAVLAVSGFLFSISGLIFLAVFRRP